MSTTITLTPQQRQALLRDALAGAAQLARGFADDADVASGTLDPKNLADLEGVGLFLRDQLDVIDALAAGWRA